MSKVRAGPAASLSSTAPLQDMMAALGQPRSKQMAWLAVGLGHSIYVGPASSAGLTVWCAQAWCPPAHDDVEPGTVHSAWSGPVGSCFVSCVLLKFAGKLLGFFREMEPEGHRDT